MNICLVSLDYRPYRSSGLTIYAEDLARGLSEFGHNVTVLAARRSGLPAYHKIQNIDVYRIPIWQLDWITYSWAVAKFLHRLQNIHSFHIVHFLDVHFAYAYRGPFVASIWQSFRQRLTARQGKPYHTGPIDFLRREFYYRVARQYMERPSLARTSHLIASSRSTREEFINNYGVSPHHIDLGVQGIDTNLFRPVSAHHLRKELGLADYRILLFVGFITPRKGLEYLAEAMRLLPNNIHLLIAGRWEAQYRAYISRTLGSVAARIHEVGYIPDAERATYYSMADIYVSPSLLEGLGITPIEALACETPAIVTNASSGTEEVGDTGMIVPPCDPIALANSIQTLLDDKQLRNDLGKRGRERVIQHFSYQRMTQLTLETYKRFLQHGGRIK